MRYRIGVVAGVLAVAFVSAPARAQQKTRFSSLEEALRSGGALAGGSGPREGDWIGGGRGGSFTTRGAGGAGGGGARRLPAPPGVVRAR